MALELLFVERNHICAVCVSNGHCELQALAQTLGLTHVRFPYNYPRLPVDISHDRFVLDHNRCILCSRCVRVCDEMEGAHVWDIAARGINSLLVSDLDRPWGDSENCTSCGKCVQVCPTGALVGERSCGRGNDEAEYRRRAARREERVPIHEEGESGHPVARRLLRLPHVAGRHRRSDHRRRAAGRHRLRAVGRRAGVSSRRRRRHRRGRRQQPGRSRENQTRPRALAHPGGARRLRDHQQCSRRCAIGCR